MSERVRFYCSPCGYSFGGWRGEWFVLAFGYYCRRCPRCGRKCYNL